MAKINNTTVETAAKPEPNTTPLNGGVSVEETVKKHRGAIPSMPICAVYRREDGKTVAAIVAPNGKRFEAVGRGQGSAMGELVDMGFVLSGLTDNVNDWVLDPARKVVPVGAEVIGYATISGFPLPVQGS